MYFCTTCSSGVEVVVSQAYVCLPIGHTHIPHDLAFMVTSQGNTSQSVAALPVGAFRWCILFWGECGCCILLSQHLSVMQPHSVLHVVSQLSLKPLLILAEL